MKFYRRNDGEPTLDGCKVVLRPVKVYEGLYRVCQDRWKAQTRDRTEAEALDPEWDVRVLFANVWAIRDPGSVIGWTFYTTKNVEVL